MIRTNGWKAVEYRLYLFWFVFMNTNSEWITRLLAKICKVVWIWTFSLRFSLSYSTFENSKGQLDRTKSRATRLTPSRLLGGACFPPPALPYRWLPFPVLAVFLRNSADIDVLCTTFRHVPLPALWSAVSHASSRSTHQLLYDFLYICLGNVISTSVRMFVGGSSYICLHTLPKWNDLGLPLLLLRYAALATMH